MDCQFCTELKTRKVLFNGEIIEGNRILYETENFFVFPSLGQIVEGYLLIAPKKHYLSIAQIPEELYPELVKIQKKVEEILTRNYSKPLFFEHGPLSETEKGGCCITHAHLHCVPANVNVLDYLKKHFKYIKISSYSDLNKQTPYFFLEQSENKFLFSLNEIVPSQYIRQIIARGLNTPEKWNWKSYLGLSELKNTIKKLELEFTQTPPNILPPKNATPKE